MLTYRVTDKSTGITHIVRRATGEAIIQAEPLRFFYNGIKVGKGPLQKGSIGFVNAHGVQRAYLTISARDYIGFSREVHAAFTVVNNTETQTDYFDKDHIRVERSHPLFAAVAVAVVADLEKSIARCEKRGASEWVKNYSRDLANLRAMLALN